MNEFIEKRVNCYSKEIVDLFLHLRSLIYRSSLEIQESLWANLPTYSCDSSFVRLIPFKDHINVEAKAVLDHKEELKGMKVTPKGMLQIYLNQNVPDDVLMIIFKETLSDDQE